MRPARYAVCNRVSETNGIAERVRRECAEQGIPEKVEDGVILAKIVTLAFDGSAKPSR